MKTLKVSQLLMLFAGILALLVLVQSLAMTSQANKIRNDLIHNNNVLFPAVIKNKDLQVAVIQVQQWLTDISATRGLDGLNDGFDEAAASAEQFRILIDELSILEPDKAEVYQQLLPVFEEYYRVGQVMAQAYIDGGPASGNRTMAQFDEAASAMYEEIDALLTSQQMILNEDLAHELADTEFNFFMIYIFAGLFVILLVLLVWLGRKWIVQPAGHLASELAKIADGDFSIHVQAKRDDEFGKIAAATDSIVEKLGGNLREITSAGMQVSAYAHALTYVIEEALRFLQLQSEETEKVVSSVNRLGELGQQVEEKAMKASDLSSDAKQEAQTGDQLLDKTVSATDELAGRMSRAKQTVTELAESSNNINKVMAVIQEIAEQTNLLALNAAIEAARAGDQGRGFAVVADEVRTLASRTQESASQIEAMIKEFQDRANETVSLITQNQTQASENAEASQKAIQSLRSIFEFIDELDHLNTDISEASQTQSGQSSEVQANIQRSRELTDKFMTNSAKSKRFSNELSRNARSFSQLAARLNVYSD